MPFTDKVVGTAHVANYKRLLASDELELCLYLMKANDELLLRSLKTRGRASFKHRSRVDRVVAFIRFCFCELLSFSLDVDVLELFLHEAYGFYAIDHVPVGRTSRCWEVHFLISWGVNARMVIEINGDDSKPEGMSMLDYACTVWKTSRRFRGSSFLK
jgi:hypothetical protein